MRKRYDSHAKPAPWHRRPKEVRAAIQNRRPKGLGSRLGRGLAPVPAADWVGREARWVKNRQTLEQDFPGFFTTRFFSRLPRLGGRGEGEVRRFVPKEPFVSSSGIKWNSLAVKKFKKGARSNPQNQARTLYSLNLMMKYLSSTGRLPKADFEIRIPEAITIKGPFLVMRDLSGERLVVADKLTPSHFEAVKVAISALGRQISLGSNQWIHLFTQAGLEYPTPDFIPSNIIANVKGDRITRIWIIDQFRDRHGAEPRFRRESVRRIREKWVVPAPVQVRKTRFPTNN